jgi:hypothetical protein
VKLPPWRRRRWFGAALGSPLQRGCRFCFAAHDGEVTISKLAEWLRPDIVYSGGQPSTWQMHDHACVAANAELTALEQLMSARVISRPFSLVNQEILLAGQKARAANCKKASWLSLRKTSTKMGSMLSSGAVRRPRRHDKRWGTLSARAIFSLSPRHSAPPFPRGRRTHAAPPPSARAYAVRAEPWSEQPAHVDLGEAPVFLDVPTTRP